MSKAELRRRVWDLLTAQGVSRFPGAVGRIPNFVGAERAAHRLAARPEWQRVAACKCNPDAPQWPIRHRALEEGKIVYMAVPRLRQERCFLELDPKRIVGSLRQAASIRGAARAGRPISVQDVSPVDLVVCGSVAVDRWGGRLGKGGGYADLEYALLAAAGKVGAATPIVTTVHSLQVLGEAVEMQAHDLPVDLIVTPEGAIATRTRLPRPAGIFWDRLPPEKVAAIPALERLRRNERRQGGGR